jgi:dihydroorotase-like cyclic amidohydrolase
VRSATILRAALAYAGALGLPIVDHAEESSLTADAEANDGFVATVLGLRGWPAAAEEMAVARDLAVLADVIRDVRAPGCTSPTLHLGASTFTPRETPACR